MPPGRYFWRVRAADDRGEVGDWSAAQEFTQRQASPTPSPPTFVKREMQFHWDAQDGMRYRVEIARDPQFSRPLLDQTLDTPTLLTRRLRMGTYYVRVQTIAADGSPVPFGKAVQFDIPAPLWLKILLPALTIIAIVK